MIGVAGKKQEPIVPAIQPGQDKRGRYKKACIELADSFGYERGRVCFWWSQIALERMAHGEPQAVAEWQAMRDIEYVYDQRGREPN